MIIVQYVYNNLMDKMLLILIAILMDIMFAKIVIKLIFKNAQFVENYYIDSLLWLLLYYLLCFKTKK